MPIRTAFRVLVLLLASVGPATAFTLASVSGSGELSISATGTVYFDASALALTNLTLTADSAVVIGGPLPGDLSGTPTTTLTREDLMGAQQLSILGDLYVDPFVYSGSLAVSADRIHVVGMLSTNGGPIAIESGNGGGGCEGAPGVVVSTGDLEGRCIDGSIVWVPSPSLPDLSPEIGGPVPEPGAALLFGSGALVLAHALRRGR